MFLSKIWFFVMAVAAAAALTVALVMPKPAERAAAVSERKRLQRACSVVGIVMRSNARSRVQNVASVARGYGLGEVTAKAARGELVSGAENSEGREKLAELVKEFDGSGIPKPSFLFLVDGKGRVVARQGLDENSYGDVLSGIYAIDDALAGYLRDDVWLYEDNLYRVAVSPVFTDSLARSGALAIGYAFDKPFADKIGNDLEVQLGFYSNGKAIASNHPIQVHDDIVAKYNEALRGKESDGASDCGLVEPFEVTAGGTTYTTLMSRLPGEATDVDSFYAVFVPRPTAVGFFGTLDAVKKDDLAFGNFPWLGLGLGLLVVVGIGLGLMVFETDLPLRKLGADAVALAQSESKERLEEDSHRGKFGSIARSVNIHIDKLSREARAAKKEFDQLIGPAPEASGNIGLPGLSEPAKVAPPPPSEFKFSDSAPKPLPAGAAEFDLGLPKPPTETTPAPGLDLGAAPAKPAAPKPPPPRPKPPVPSAKPPTPQAAAAEEPEAAEREIGADGSESEEAYILEVFQDFVALKRRCGESIDSLTMDKFARKLRKNRDALIEKHGCKSVKFQVYIKDGKAALKASPVK